VYNPENKILKVRFLQGPHQNQEKTFNSREKKIVRIGRSKQAEVVYKDDSVSRIQCTIVYEKGSWNLYDGYLDNGNKGSTNGLWLLASTKIEITNEMVLKTGNTGMIIKLLDSAEHR
jgi:pSer/pThr/pTyr-binding forkhead associated (FHA) protein